MASVNDWEEQKIVGGVFPDAYQDPKSGTIWTSKAAFDAEDYDEYLGENWVVAAGVTLSIPK